MEKFDPLNPKYKRVEDLPKKEMAGFKNVENGFVKKTAIDDQGKAEDMARMSRVQKGYEKILEFKKKGLYKEAQILLEELEKDMDIMEKG